MRKGLGRHNRRSPGGFNPGYLFSGGIVAGAWYDPSDLSTLFQDSAGTTPVTAVEQVVGLMLDKSRGLVLGPELVTNGSFSSPTGWTTDTGWAISGGTANAAASPPGTSVNQPLSISAGRTYKVTFTVSNYVSGSCAATLFNGTNGPAVSANGTYTCYLTKAGALLAGGVYAVSTFTGSIDNISVVEVPGAHATATGTARPTLSARVNLLTKTEQFDDAAVWLQIVGGTGVAPVRTANAAIAPDGTLTADRLQFSLGGGATTSDQSYIYQNVTITADSTNSVWLKSNTASSYDLYLRCSNTSVTVTVTPTWQRFSVVGVVSAGTIHGFGLRGGQPVPNSNTADILAWGADLRVTNDGVNIPPYQRVNTATDYDTAGFPLYLSFAGAQAMSTPANIDFATVTSDGLARRNLLLNPTQFDVSSVWTVQANASVTGVNTGIAPDGSQTADQITFTSNTNDALFQGFSAAASTTYTASVYVKGSGGQVVQVGCQPNAVTPAFTSVTLNGTWQRISATATSGGAGILNVSIDLVSGSTPCVIEVWGAQLETGSTATAFQNIGTDKMLVCAGVRKLSDAAIGDVVELSANAGTNFGSFFLFAPRNTATADFGYRSIGTTLQDATSAASFASPYTAVLSGVSNIPAPVATLRVNGSQAASSTGNQGTGNYGSYPLFIGARNLSSLFLTGRIYGLVVAGSQYTAGQVSATEAYMNGKTRAY